jgi:mRNA-degrading endonuclease RelE of RelBE toxin-antitoxin system
MPYEIRYSSEAIDQLKGLRAFDRTAILDQIEQVLAVNPMTESKARVKRLREPAPTQYRLRVGEFRVFYDVEQDTVLIIQILSKQDSLDFLGGSS